MTWQSPKQDIFTRLTLEAEHIACSEAFRASRWVLQLCKDSKHNQNDENDETDKLAENNLYDKHNKIDKIDRIDEIDEKDENKPLPILCDNEGELAHITSEVIKYQMKHIDESYHNCLNLHEWRIVHYWWISTHENEADIIRNILGRQ